MAKIAELSVNVTADTKKHDSRMKKAADKIDDFNKKVGKADKGTSRFAATMKKAGKAAATFAKGTAAAGVAALGLVTKFRELANAQRELQLRSGQFGIKTKDLKAIVFTLEDMGVNADATIDAIQTINERVEEARQGQGTAVDVFKALRIDVEKFSKLDVASKFERLSIAFAGVQDSATRTLASTDLFGDEASAIVGAFKQMSKFSSELRKNMEEVKVDTKITDAGEKLNASLNRFSREANKFLAGLEPLVTFMSTQLERLTDRLSGKTQKRGISRSAEGTGLGADIDLLFGGVRRQLGRDQKPTRGAQVLTDAQKRAMGGFVPDFDMAKFMATGDGAAPPRSKQKAGLTSPFAGAEFLPTPGAAQSEAKRLAPHKLSSFIESMGSIGGAIAQAIGPSLKQSLSELSIPIGPRAVGQEANAALTKGSEAAFSAINRAANPQMKLDEQRNIKLDQLLLNGVQVLQAIAGGGKTVIDTVIF